MKKTLILVVILFVLITVIVILGNIITVGEKMTAVVGAPYLEYAFYLILVGLFTYLVYVAILQPTRRIHNAPEFPVLSVEDKENGLTDEEYKKRLLAFAERLWLTLWVVSIPFQYKLVSKFSSNEKDEEK